MPAQPPLETAIATLESAARWLREGAALVESAPAPIVRLGLLVDILEDVPAWRRALAAAVTRACADGDAMPALEAGLPNDRGLWPESSDRLARRLLPSADSARDLGALVSRMFPTMRDALWLGFVPDELSARLVRLLDDGTRGAGITPTFAPVGATTLDVIALVATRTSALGLSREIRARSPEVPLAASPFFLLPRLCDALFSGIGSAGSCRDQIVACSSTRSRRCARTSRSSASPSTWSTASRSSSKNLERLRDLLAVHEAQGEDAKAAAAFRVLAQHRRGARTRSQRARHVRHQPAPPGAQGHRARRADRRALHHAHARTVVQDDRLGAPAAAC